MDLAQALGELRFPPEIVADADRVRLAGAARGLPPIWECAVVESRLAPGTPVDLLAACADSVGRAVGAWPCPPPPELETWVGDPAMGPVPQVWLEWDDARTHAAPLFWWGVDPALYDTTRPVPAAGWPAELGRRLGATPAVQAVLQQPLLQAVADNPVAERHRFARPFQYRDARPEPRRDRGRLEEVFEFLAAALRARPKAIAGLP